MPCPEIEAIERYAIGDSDPDLRSALRAHLGWCDSCRTRVERARENRALDRTLRALETNRDPALPERIGGYRVLSDLRRSSEGRVFEALQEARNRRVALRILPDRLTRSPARFPRFLQEAELLAALAHPNIATLVSLEEHQGLHFLTHELSPGSFLDERLRSGPLSLEDALHVARQIAAALEAAHGKSVVHGDLKPGNVLVTEELSVKVMGFGLAEGAFHDADLERIPERIPSPETLLGTPGYLSPERVHAGEADEKGDVWALGVILYESLAGKDAFPGGTASERIAKTLLGPPDWALLASSVPSPVRHLLASCMHERPEERPRGIGAVRKLLEEAIAERVFEMLSHEAREPASGDLPIPPASFLGQERQIEEIVRALGTARLVTLVGIEGSGKTRLAIETAKKLRSRFRDGVRFVDCASAGDALEVVRAVARAFGVRGAKDIPGLLRSRNLLLVLDHADRALEAVATLLESLVREAPDLGVLCTSRAPLGLPGETVVPVVSLSLPTESKFPTLEEIRESEAVRLFEARASLVDPSLRLSKANADALVQICRLVDGLPLAVQLAAAQVATLTPQEIARGLEERFGPAMSARTAERAPRTVDLPYEETASRPSSLRLLADWIYDALPPEEQALLRRLAVFPASFTLDAVEIVCSGDGIETWQVLDLLSSLVRNALVERDVLGWLRTKEARYRLPETVRGAARDRLAKSEETTARRAHRDAYLARAETLNAELLGPGQVLALRRLEADGDHFHEALAAAGESREEGQKTLRLAGALGRFWDMSGRAAEGLRTYEDLLVRLSTQGRTGAHARVLDWTGRLALRAGDPNRARDCHRESLAIFESVGDPAGQASAIGNLGTHAVHQGDLDKARELYERSLALERETAHTRGEAFAQYRLGALYLRQGKLLEGRDLLERAAALFTGFGDRFHEAACRMSLCQPEQEGGDDEAALAALGACLETYGEIEETSSKARCLYLMGSIHRAKERTRKAAACFAESLALHHALGERDETAALLEVIGSLLAPLDPRRAARFLGAALGLREASGSVLSEVAREQHALDVAAVAKALGEVTLAESLKEGKDTKLDALLEEAVALRGPSPA